jgi:hypothetical protein
VKVAPERLRDAAIDLGIRVFVIALVWLIVQVSF